ncbi:hypothetical protein GCM10008171_02140 [Methylopila jiangsuensis]|uniref:DUF411 domain-containing protein n=1 Tax=Methylopila jiangsuensis TaxID=586230 RepID=A0A9W6JEI6_9HYPH|nr:DUF411 domain-containing protein [Methylopila jiangsuensis]MDR6287380.1 hypothetical protein [Methylopila jiangsuensis]GLK74961.1 hypothetical protein GCM10008171_02140 [Methylopila jiangsuensis]
MNWNGMIAGLVAAAVLGSTAAAADELAVKKTSGCGCCIGWIRHMEENGFTVKAEDVPMGALMQDKLAAGLRVGQTSCHTGRIGGYVVEGHVPAREVRRLLAERPDAFGLAVPDMPTGSPGMPGKAEAYEVLLLKRGGDAEVFASYPASHSDAD